MNLVVSEVFLNLNEPVTRVIPNLHSVHQHSQVAAATHSFHESLNFMLI